MLKKFFLNFLSSFVGAWVALVLFCVVAVIVLVGIFAQIGSAKADVESLKKNSVLKIELTGPIEEREVPADLNYIDLVQGNLDRAQTLDVLTQAIREAKVNKNIKMIYLDCRVMSASPATLHALRVTLQDFKKSGKKIYAYADAYTTGSYYLATTADSIFINPHGMMEIHGLGSTSLFMKDFFDKIGVEFTVAKVGTFKSAVEPYIMNHMSEPARAQLDTLFGNMWGLMTKEMGESRKLSSDSINALINKYNLMLEEGKFAVKTGLADRAIYGRSIKGVIADAAGVKEKELNFVSPKTIVSQTSWGLEYGSKRQLAVLYAAGEIAEGTSTGINCETLCPVIVKLADDDNVKAMVLRVNSPGGSVFGSEEIGEALEYFKSKGKKLCVSMGDYAASGGYWISCGADRIFADPLTITGSIGIFGLFPNISGLMNKVGVNAELVATNPEADFPSLFFPMSEEQSGAMQVYIEKGYDKFIKRVATGRRMKESQVRRIAEGRVWDASKAVKLGLVDQLGTLENACDWVRNQVDDGQKLEVVAYPQLEPGIWDMLQTAGQSAMLQLQMGGRSELMQMLTQKIMTASDDEPMSRAAALILSRKPVQARMIEIKVRL